MRSQADFRGRTALITGASSGIGRAFADELGRRGARLVLVARNEAKLSQVAQELRGTFGVEVVTIAQDLTEAGAAASVARALESKGVSVDLLINNAGIGQYGAFGDLPLEEELRTMRLNVLAPVELTHRLLPDLRARRGAVIFVSSLQGVMPFSYWSTYAATKAFQVSFAESLYGEIKAAGVDVLAILPGITQTDFFRANEVEGEFPFPVRRPEQVVRTALANLGKRATVIDGMPNRFAAWLMGLLPRGWAIGANARLLKPRAEQRNREPAKLTESFAVNHNGGNQ